MTIGMKDGMEACNPKIGKRRIQHCHAVKLGYIMRLTTKAEISRWKEFFQNQVEEILQTKVQLAISAARINDGTGFADDSTSKSSSLRTKRKKVNCWGAHIEIVKDQQVKVKRAIIHILACNIPSWMHSMPLKFIPSIRHDMGSN